MKKKNVLIMGVVLMMAVATFTGCGKKVKCSYCGELKRCETGTGFLGQETNICKDCQKKVENLGKGLEEFGDNLEELFE